MDDVTKLTELADEIDRRHMSGAVRASDNIASRIVDALRSSAATITTLQAELEQAREALKPFADCCEYISDDEDDEEWAKFRLLIKDYRRAQAVLKVLP